MICNVLLKSLDGESSLFARPTRRPFVCFVRASACSNSTEWGVLTPSPVGSLPQRLSLISSLIFYRQAQQDGQVIRDGSVNAPVRHELAISNFGYNLQA